MRDFTKNWRVKHDEPLTYNERIINSACDIIEKQDERITGLELIKRIDDEMFYDIKQQYPRIADLQEKVEWRDKEVKQALKPRT